LSPTASLITNSLAASNSCRRSRVIHPARFCGGNCASFC